MPAEPTPCPDEPATRPHPNDLPAAPMTTSNDTLAHLAAVIESRKPAAGGDPQKSYVARLFTKGDDAILKKIGEEATEAVMAAKDGARDRIVNEFADLWFHSMIALAHWGLSPAEVLAELERREGLSGLEEKALRKVQSTEQEGRKA
jgi:phosphoribosyl-ATP pyrophosphohydrolase